MKMKEIFINLKITSYMNRKVLRRMFGGIKVNGIGRKGYSIELMQLFGDLDVLSFVRISRLNRIGPVNIMGSKRKVSQVFNNNVPEAD